MSEETSEAGRSIRPASSSTPSGTRPASSSTLSVAEPALDLDVAPLLRLQQRRVVAFVLVGITLGELGDRPVEGVAAPEVGGDRGPVAGACGLDVDPRVPDVEVAHRGEAAHRLAVGRRGRLQRVAALAAAEAALAPGDRDAGGEPLDVPLERPGRVSPKSLHSKTRRRSGAAKTSKLERWASPQSWARRPVSGAAAKSAAITAAPRRKKANAEVSMRP